MTTAFALSRIEQDGRRVYLSRQAQGSNAMLTLSLIGARLWASALEVDVWLRDQPEATRAALAGQRLLITPVELQIADEVAGVIAPESQRAKAS